MKKRLLLFGLVLAVLGLAFMRTNAAGTYRAVIAQEGEADPYEAYVYENGLGVTFAPVRADVGQYDLNASANAFPSNGKVFMLATLYNEGTDATNLCLIKLRRWDGNTLRVSTFQQDPETGLYVAADGCSFYLQVIVYP